MAHQLERSPDPIATRLIINEAGSSLALCVASAKLVVVSEAKTRQEKVLDSSSCTLGSAPQNDLVVDDDTLSRFHAKVSADQRGYVIRDLNSKNGTWVDGVRVLEAWLHDGATLSLGNVQLRFSVQKKEFQLPLSEKHQLGRLIGSSVAMRRVYTLAEQFAASTYPVLIEGETGTGKELAAEAIHKCSGRRNGPLEIFDCTTIPKDLFEGELFGWKKGAFTGALSDYKGALGRAHGGTLFIDEIGELDLDLQAKLLRAVQEGSYRPLRSGAAKKSNFRLIVATRRNLEAQINDGQFRDDLFYRICGLRLHLPPLRSRPEDIALILQNFIARELKEAGRELRSFPRLPVNVVSALREHPWPGNVRQLLGFAMNLIALSSFHKLTESQMLSALECLPAGQSTVPEPSSLIEGLLRVQAADGGGFQAGRRQVIDTWEQAAIQYYLQQAGYVVAKAAKLAGMHRQDFHRLMRRQGVNLADIKP